MIAKKAVPAGKQEGARAGGQAVSIQAGPAPTRR
jgi:hypothetical protein